MFRLFIELTDMNKNKCILLCLIFIVLASCNSTSDQVVNDNENVEEIQKVVLGSVQIGKHSTQFYIAYGEDSAILGFSVSNGSEQERYFPMYASTYRGIPSVVLDVFVSKSQEEMWVRSSWSGNEILAYHRVGADISITQYGEVTFLDKPMPEFLSGGGVPFPELIIESVSKKASFKHDEELPP